MLSSSACCAYFRHLLLKEPEAKKLEAEIFYKDNVRRCTRCGKPFASTGNRAKYYADCKAIVQREQKAAYARRRRAEGRKIEA